MPKRPVEHPRTVHCEIAAASSFASTVFAFVSMRYFSVKTESCASFSWVTEASASFSLASSAYAWAQSAAVLGVLACNSIPVQCKLRIAFVNVSVRR